VFPNGTDHGAFHPRPRDAARRRWGLDPERFLVAFAGRFEEEKGLHRLLEAVQGLPDVGLLLAGSGSLKPAGPQVLLAGPMAHGDVPDILSAADAFVLPTRVEGCSNAVIEAMACGLPVVTSRGAFMDDLVDDASSLRVDPESVGEIREAIRTLSRDRGLAGRMGEAALARASRFCVFERTKAILEWATALPPAGRRGSRVHDRPVKSER
jgi:teichuronic acid biosynthesis glycosyltransferase TuaC